MREAIILAGGFGTRLKKIIDNIPKPMAPIGEKPFLQIILDNLLGKKFNHIVLCVGYKYDVIQKYFGDNYKGIKITYSIENNPLGTGGAIKKGLKYCKNDFIYVFNGDTYIEIDTELIEKKYDSSINCMIVGVRVEDAERYGKILIKDNFLTGFEEKGIKGSGVINAGCYVFQKNELESYSIETNFSIEYDYFIKNYATKKIPVIITNSKFIDIGIPEDYEKAQLELKI
jgi:D-glycero-alpha-D-manno-heptose 1-phosphate guanylyltransferase